MIEQAFIIHTKDGSFEDFYPFTLEELRKHMEEVSPEPDYIVSIETTTKVRIPRRIIDANAEAHGIERGTR